MCGIAGLLSMDPGDISLPLLKRMTDAIAHRGPDGEGFWTGEGGRIGLGSRRLSVIDTSENGKQPMQYAGGRYTIVYNGEIYNYRELKKGLISEGFDFRTGTDTEVLLALYHKKKAECLGDLDGMFSFALYDAEEHCLFCARDRFGEKPFFFTHEPGKIFRFGSEMKAVWAGGYPRQVNGKMLYNYLAYGLLQNVQHPSETFYQGIYRLEKGHALTISTRDLTLRKRPYWGLEPGEDEGPMEEEEAREEFRSLMQRSVQRRLRSDVPVGEDLSGGLDSTLLLHLMRTSLGATNIPVFSARFPGFPLDEGPYIREAASAFGAELHDCYPNGIECWDQWEKVFYHQEEPFGSAGIYAQFKVMQTAREAGVTVLIDGQGADEILAGYPHYGRRGWKGALESRLPGVARRLRRLRANRAFLNRDFGDAYGKECFLPGRKFDYRFKSLNGALHYDIFHGGLSDLLRYSDRNAMAHGREVRLPFLDHELVRFMLRLPAVAKIRDGQTKYLLREAYAKALPESILQRTDKVGFEPPQRLWMTEAGFADRIREAKGHLIKEGILTASALRKPVEPKDAYGRGDGSWEWLMASGLYI